jgi:hypothetical protein
LRSHAEPATGPGGEGEGSVVCLGDAFDDCQAEADTCVVVICSRSACEPTVGATSPEDSIVTR